MSSSRESLPPGIEFEKEPNLEHLEAITTNRDAFNPLEEEEDALPPGYFKSYKFIGSMIAIVLLANSLFIGYSMPVRIIIP
jgi:hypothetical protein